MGPFQVDATGGCQSPGQPLTLPGARGRRPRTARRIPRPVRSGLRSAPDRTGRHRPAGPNHPSIARKPQELLTLPGEWATFTGHSSNDFGDDFAEVIAEQCRPRTTPKTQSPEKGEK